MGSLKETNLTSKLGPLFFVVLLNTANILEVSSAVLIRDTPTKSITKWGS